MQAAAALLTVRHPFAVLVSFNKVPHRLMTLAARMRCSESRYALGSSVQRQVNSRHM